MAHRTSCDHGIFTVEYWKNGPDDFGYNEDKDGGDLCHDSCPVCVMESKLRKIKNDLLGC